MKEGLKIKTRKAALCTKKLSLELFSLWFPCPRLPARRFVDDCDYYLFKISAVDPAGHDPATP